MTERSSVDAMRGWIAQLEKKAAEAATKTAVPSGPKDSIDATRGLITAWANFEEKQKKISRVKEEKPVFLIEQSEPTYKVTSRATCEKKRSRHCPQARRVPPLATKPPKRVADENALPVSSSTETIEPRKMIPRPEQKSIEFVEPRKLIPRPHQPPTRIHETFERIQRAKMTKRLQFILQVWRSAAYFSALRRREATSRATRMRLKWCAGRSLLAWRKQTTILQRNRFLRSILTAWSDHTLRIAKAAKFAEASLRWQRIRRAWCGLRRGVRISKGEREAKTHALLVEEERRRDHKAARWRQRRVKSTVFVRWLENATSRKEERKLRDLHAERRKRVLALEARLAAASAVSSSLEEREEEKEKPESIQQENVDTLPMDVKRTRQATASQMRIQQQRLTQQHHVRVAGTAKLDARFKERQARRKELASQTEIRLEQRRAELRAARDRKENEEYNKIRAEREARAKAEADAEKARALCRQQSLVARLHFERACMQWRGIVPWRQMMRFVETQQLKALRWYADGLLQRAWAAWMQWREVCRRHLLKKRQRAIVWATRIVERSRCRVPLARWVSAVRDVALLGAKVATNHRVVLAQRHLALWRDRASARACVSALRWTQAIQCDQHATRRRIFGKWLAKIRFWRQGAALESRRDAKWGKVRSWIIN